MSDEPLRFSLEGTLMPELAIGVWIKREGAFGRHEDGTWYGPRWHVVESVVADRAVVRCGKEMHRVASAGELEVSALMPLTRLIGQPQLCKGGCQDREPVPEDDGSTQPVETVP